MLQDIEKNDYLFKDQSIIIKGDFAQILFIICQDISAIIIS